MKNLLTSCVSAFTLIILSMYFVSCSSKKQKQPPHVVHVNSNTPLSVCHVCGYLQAEGVITVVIDTTSMDELDYGPSTAQDSTEIALAFDQILKEEAEKLANDTNHSIDDY